MVAVTHPGGGQSVFVGGGILGVRRSGRPGCAWLMATGPADLGRLPFAVGSRGRRPMAGAGHVPGVRLGDGDVFVGVFGL